MLYGMKLSLIVKICRYLILIFLVCLLGCTQKDNKVSITYSTWGSDTEINIIKPVIEDFKKLNPDINVDLIHIPQNYFQKLHMMVAANLSPDVIFINNMNIPLYDSANVLENLEPYIKKSESLSKDNIFSGALNTMSHKGKILALPRDISNVVIYYNKDIFDKYKIPYPSSDWTMKDLISKGKSLTKDTDNDGKTDIFGVSFESLPIYYLPFVWSNGGNIFNSTNTEFVMNQSQACSGIQVYADFRNRYNIAPKDFEAGNNTMAQLFIQEKVAMYISGRWNVPKFREVIDFNWDVINFPKGKSGSIVGLDSSGWAISKQCKRKDLAWKLIEYMDSRKIMQKITATGLITPARKDLANSNIYLDPLKKPKNAVVFLKIAESSKPTPKIQRWNEVIDLINQSLEPVWSGNKTACESLKVVKDDVDRLLN